MDGAICFRLQGGLLYALVRAGDVWRFKYLIVMFEGLFLDPLIRTNLERYIDLVFRQRILLYRRPYPHRGVWM